MPKNHRRQASDEEHPQHPISRPHECVPEKVHHLPTTKLPPLRKAGCAPIHAKYYPANHPPQLLPKSNQPPPASYRPPAGASVLCGTGQHYELPKLHYLPEPHTGIDLRH